MIQDISIHFEARLPFGITLYRREVDGRVWVLMHGLEHTEPTRPRWGRWGSEAERLRQEGIGSESS